MRRKESNIPVAGIVQALRNKQPVTNSQYAILFKACKKVASRAYAAYKMPTFVFNPIVREDTLDDITTIALVKALNGYDPTRKTKFMTYYYNKARSCTKVHAGKLHRRYKMINTVQLPEQRDTTD